MYNLIEDLILPPNKQFENSPLLAMSSLKWEDMSACQSCPLTACGINLGTFAHPPPPRLTTLQDRKTEIGGFFNVKKTLHMFYSVQYRSSFYPTFFVLLINKTELIRQQDIGTKCFVFF